MKRFLMTMVVVCVLSSSALAGEIPSDGVAAPAPPVPNPITSQALPNNTLFAPGDIPSGGFAKQVMDAALSALLTALAF